MNNSIYSSLLSNDTNIGINDEQGGGIPIVAFDQMVDDFFAPDVRVGTPEAGTIFVQIPVTFRHGMSSTTRDQRLIVVGTLASAFCIRPRDTGTTVPNVGWDSF